MIATVSGLASRAPYSRLASEALASPRLSRMPTLPRRSPSNNGSGTISGGVTDLATNEALAGVNVYLDETRQGTATGPNGDYVLDNVEPGSYTLVASLIGYKRYEANVTVTTGEFTTLNIQLSEDVPPA